jgi:hypothetical protein
MVKVLRFTIVLTCVKEEEIYDCPRPPTVEVNEAVLTYFRVPRPLTVELKRETLLKYPADPAPRTVDIIVLNVLT